MASLSVGEAAAAAGGQVVAGDPRALLRGAAIDSRAVRGGELFFAFRGAHADGHRFVGDAFGRGAAGAMVEDPAAAGITGMASMPAAAEAEAERTAGGAAAGGAEERRAWDGRAVIQVADTLAALHDVARSVRRRVPRRLVGITGSAGKTTTKELLAAMLASRFRVARNPGNFNNLYGFPLSLLNVPDDAEWMVAELGMSTPGELRRLSLLGRPDVALFTVVRPAHLEFFADLRGIAEAKAELLAGLAADGLVVANAGDPEVVRIARRHLAEGEGRRVVWYGIRSGAEAGSAAASGAGPRDAAADAPIDSPPPLDVAASDLAAAPGGVGTRFVLWAGGRSQLVHLPLHGRYNVENCLAAAACAVSLGVPLADIAAAAERARPAAGRGVVSRVAMPGGGELTVIDDSYNSNPDALAQALASAARLPAARRLAVLGDMLELGPAGPEFHREGGLEAARLGFGPLAGVGELARALVAAARAAGAGDVVWYADAATAAAWAAGAARPGDLVLVKGSRGVGLDAVVRRLLALGGSGAAKGEGDTAGSAGDGGAARRGGEA